MNEKNDFALVPRSPNTVEKSQPGAKRVLSGMVADTLGLARKHAPSKRRIVILAPYPEMRTHYAEVLELCFNETSVVKFGDGDDAWLELLGRLPDLLITEISHPGLACEEMLHRLQERKAKLAVLVVSHGSEKFEELQGRFREWPDVDVTFLPWPWNATSLVGALEVALKAKNLLTP